VRRSVTMVTVTERAAVALEELAKANPEQQVVKLVPDGDRIIMKAAAANDADEVVQHGDQTLLIIDASIVDALDGAEIDCQTALVAGEPKTRFRFAKPPDSGNS